MLGPVQPSDNHGSGKHDFGVENTSPGRTNSAVGGAPSNFRLMDKRAGQNCWIAALAWALAPIPYWTMPYDIGDATTMRLCGLCGTVFGVLGMVCLRRGLFSAHIWSIVCCVVALILATILQWHTGGTYSPVRLGPSLFAVQTMSLAGGQRVIILTTIAFAAQTLVVAWFQNAGALPPSRLGPEASFYLSIVDYLVTMCSLGLMNFWSETQWEASAATLRTLADDAVQASQAKSTFLAVMSHELRTPLNHVLMAADLIEAELGIMSDTELGKPSTPTKLLPRHLRNEPVSGFGSSRGLLGRTLATNKVLNPRKIESLQSAAQGIASGKGAFETSELQPNAQVDKLPRIIGTYADNDSNTGGSAVTTTPHGASAAEICLDSANTTKSGSLTDKNSVAGKGSAAKPKLSSRASSVESQAECAELLDMLRGSATHLLDIINDILDLSKIESGKMESCASPCDVVVLIARAVNAFSGYAASKGIGLGCTFPPVKLPRMLVDTIHLKQIIFNIVGNAVKFTETGRVEVGVAVVKNGRLDITVKDTGPGIPSKHLPNLFKHFSQSESSRTTRRYGGTGLGLVISKQLAAMMNGDLSVESTEGKGSTFTLSIPMVVAPVGDKGQAPERTQPATEPFEVSCVSRSESVSAPGTTPAVQEALESEPLEICSEEGANSASSRLPRHLRKPQIRQRRAASVAASLSTERDGEEQQRDSLKGLHVLLVDDNVVNCRLAASLLKHCGAEVTTLYDGQSAIDVCCGAQGAHCYDVMLLDICMPGVDGYDVARAIREDESARGPGARRLRILALTAMSLADDRDRALALGMDDYVTKPFSKASLIAKLRDGLPPGEKKEH